MDSKFGPRTLDRKNRKGLALGKPSLTAAPTPPPPEKDDLEISHFAQDLTDEDLIFIKELGAGNGGTVSKVMHAKTKVIMAKKIIHVEAKEKVRKQIVRELQVMHNCKSPYIVSFYGAFMKGSNSVIMCMELMDCGALDSISKKYGPVRVDVLGKIAVAMLEGLTYLYNTHRIMHRDIKPSNVVVNSKGEIKLCDFGVSGELVNSVADTFVGTSTYMAPERIQGGKYTVRSDVWSFGLTLMELAVGRFPYIPEDAEDDEGDGPIGILDLLQQIVHEPAPRLPESDAFPQILDDMLQKCLLKEGEQRPTPQELLDNELFIQAAKRTPVALDQWAQSLLKPPPPDDESEEESDSEEEAPAYSNGRHSIPRVPVGGSGQGYGNDRLSGAMRKLDIR